MEKFLATWIAIQLFLLWIAMGSYEYNVQHNLIDCNKVQNSLLVNVFVWATMPLIYFMSVWNYSDACKDYKSN